MDRIDGKNGKVQEAEITNSIDGYHDVLEKIKGRVAWRLKRNNYST